MRALFRFDWYTKGLKHLLAISALLVLEIYCYLVEWARYQYIMQMYYQYPDDPFYSRTTPIVWDAWEDVYQHIPVQDFFAVVVITLLVALIFTSGDRTGWSRTCAAAPFTVWQLVLEKALWSCGLILINLLMMAVCQSIYTAAFGVFDFGYLMAMLLRLCMTHFIPAAVVMLLSIWKGFRRTLVIVVLFGLALFGILFLLVQPIASSQGAEWFIKPLLKVVKAFKWLLTKPTGNVVGGLTSILLFAGAIPLAVRNYRKKEF